MCLLACIRLYCKRSWNNKLLNTVCKKALLYGTCKSDIQYSAGYDMDGFVFINFPKPEKLKATKN